MKTYLEHANISVQDLDEAIKFLRTAFPHFEIRGSGKDQSGHLKWVHIGTEDTYLALQRTDARSPDKILYESPGVNHLGFVVPDVSSLAQRLLTAGYKRSFEADPHPFRKRDYFMDNEGNDYEFVQYYSEKNEERNDYST